MHLYRFSPIQNENALRNAIAYTHLMCHTLCKQSLGSYLPVAGNIGIFCHYEEEFALLEGITKTLTDASQSMLKKYYRLHAPIVIPAQGDIPNAIYTHLYIRKPDPYRAHVGDVDFILEKNKYTELKQSVFSGTGIPGARVFPRTDLDMIELFDPDIDALAYIQKSA